MRARQARALQVDLDRALVLHKQQQFDTAAQLYRKILKAAPDHFDALHLLGAIEGQNGRFGAALELLRRAVALKPDSANVHNNLGNTYASLQRHAEALSCFERSLALKPDNPKALRNRGNALRKLGRHAEALASLDRAIELQSDFTDAMASRGELLQEMGRHDEAADAFRAALAGGKDLETLHFALAALGAEPLPASAPPDYVKGLFDQYAESFDRHLVEVLKYRTPALLIDALKHAAPPRVQDAIDLGCGTGLCGPLLRPLAQRLVGVDFSPGMLERARVAGHYDELVCAELVAFLDGPDPRFDIAVAADVLIYLGDLSGVFAGIGRALRPGGLFAFSVEACAEADYRLQPSRRYAHSQAYLERLGRANGLSLVSVDAAVLREDGARAVDGLLLVLRHETVA